MTPSPDPGPVALHQWADLEVDRRLSGGSRSEVFLGTHRRRRVIVRQSSRSAAALDWELDLLEHLTGQGITVPRMVPSDRGAGHVDGMSVHEFLPGDPPTSPRDWARVADVLQAVHGSTLGWPQRPGFASSRDLRIVDRGGDVRLDLMPDDLVAQVRSAWAAVDVGELVVVHGDPGASNIRIDRERVALLDWDEARVDVPWFDLALLPADAPIPDAIDADDLTTAGFAWEVATCWTIEPEYAATRRRQLLARL